MSTSSPPNSSSSLPYKLIGSVISARNLPVGDILSSDPFVVLSLNGKAFGRTSTVLRNCNPQWNEGFYTEMYHLDHTFNLSIFDEDAGKASDLLATLSIPLRSLRVGTMETKIFPLEFAGKFKGNAAQSSSSLLLTVMVARKEGTIKVVPLQRAPPRASSSSADTEDEKASSFDALTLLQEDVSWSETHEMIRNAFTAFSDEKLSFSLSLPLYRDLLHDVLSVTSSSPAHASHDGAWTDSFLKRRKPRWVSSSKLSFAENLFLRSAPIEDNSLQINLCADETRFVLLSFANRFAMWHWAQWLQQCRQAWTTGDTAAVRDAAPLSLSPEDWAAPAERELSSSCVAVSLLDAKLQQSLRPPGRVRLSLDRPYKLLVGELTLSLQGMESVVLSVDSALPRGYMLELDVALQSDSSKERAGEKETHATENKQQKPRGSASSQALSFLSHTASAVVSSATHTAASANAHSHSHSLVFATCRDESTRFDPRDAHAKWFIDFSLEDLDTHSAASFLGRSIAKRETASATPGGTREPLRRTTSSSQAVAGLPALPSAKLSLDLSLLQGAESAEKLVAQAKCSIDALLPRSQLTHSLDESRLGEEVVTEVSFDRSIGVSISIETAQNLVVPEIAMKPFTGLFAKCRFVGANGASIDESSATEVRTASLSISAAGRQAAQSFRDQNNVFSFKREQLAPFRSGFFRIEFFCGDGLATNTLLGSAYVPTEFCLAQLKPAVLAFPVTRRKASPTVLSLAQRDGKGLGDVLVRLQRIEDLDQESNSSSSSSGHGKRTNNKAPLPAMTITARAHECSAYNTQWFGECLSAAQRDAPGSAGDALSVERVQVQAHFMGLVLRDVALCSVAQSLAAEMSVKACARGLVDRFDGGTSQRESSSSSSPPLSTQRLSGEHAAAAVVSPTNSPQFTNETFLVSIFENQRRNPYPPFDWSAEAFTRARWSNADFSVSYALHDKDDARPPEGFAFADDAQNDWKIDKAYVKTDENGWVYGFTFEKLLKKYQRQQSSTSSLNAHARRRAWTRRVVRVTPTSATETPTTLSAATVQRMFDAKNAKSAAAVAVAASPAKTTRTTQDEGKWRDRLREKFPDAILLTCKERDDAHGGVFMPWAAVESVSIVSPSILSVCFTVQRSFAAGVFHPAPCVLYVSNCPAHTLRALFSERLFFCAMRSRLEEVREDAAAEQSLNSPIKTSGESVKNSTALSEEEEDEEETPATQELSAGSELMATMDDAVIALQREIAALDEQRGAPSAPSAPPRSSSAVQTALYHRCCRLRLYMAALIAFEIQDWHGFKTENVQTILEHDFASCRRISLEDPVYTAQNRIDFLLDVAEKRIRDAALCGWPFRQHDFVLFVETFANDYFVEIVGLLAAFFEEKGQSNVKGLVSKVTLLQTFFKNDDRLQVIIESALRPYSLTTAPPAKLSVFLDTRLLVDWYRDVLQTEMRLCVSNVFQVWRDREKNVSGQDALYTHAIAWVPQRLRGNNGVFLTNIPEDVVEYLVTYLTSARLRLRSDDETTAAFDAKVFSAYANAFIFVAEVYAKELLSSKKWYALQDEEELVEYVTWQCSIANDAQRVIGKQLMVPQRIIFSARQDERETETESETQRDEAFDFQVQESTAAFDRLQLQALDQLSCVTFLCVFHGKEELLCGDNLFSAFLKFYQEERRERETATQRDRETENALSRKFLDSVVEDTVAYLRGNKEFLSPQNYALLLEIVANKLLLLFLRLLVQARHAGEVSPSAACAAQRGESSEDSLLGRLVEQGMALRQSLDSLFAAERVACEASRIAPSAATSLCLLLMGPVLHVLSHPVSDTDLHAVVESVDALVAQSDASSSSLSLAQGVVDALKTCLSLKSVRLYFSDEQRAQCAMPSSSFSHNGERAASAAHGTEGEKAAPQRQSIKNRIVDAIHAHPPGSRLRRFLGFSSSSPGAETRQPKECEEREHDEEDVAEHRRLQDEKSIAVDACIDQMLRDCLQRRRREVNGASSMSLRHDDDAAEPSVAQNVFSRAFSPFAAYDPHALLAQLVYSAVPAEQLKALLPHGEALHGDAPSNEKNSRLRGWLQHRGGDGPRPAARLASERFKAALSSAATAENSSSSFYENSGKGPQALLADSAQPANAMSTLPQCDDPKLSIIVNELRVDDLFYLYWFQTPRPFVVVRVADTDVRAHSPAQLSEEGSVVWTHETALALKVPKVTSSKMEIVLDLYYERYLRNTLIASASIAFNPYDPPAQISKEIVLTDFSHSPQVAQAARQAASEGRAMPKLTVVLRIISHMK